MEQVKSLLLKEGIKLWLPPYSNEDYSAGEMPQELIAKCSEKTGLAAERVAQCLKELRERAVERLLGNRCFHETGLASLHISCQHPAQDKFKVELLLGNTGGQLLTVVAEKLGVPSPQVKLIAAGRILDPSLPLQEQGITHNSEVLAVRLTDDEMETSRQMEWRDCVDKTREATRILLGKSDDGSARSLQITDQEGNAVDLPPAERESLAVAIALHDRGRVALKSKDYSRALVFFLEADKEFDSCRSDILKVVDNFAILSLDIVWCYLQLRSVKNLPDAEKRISVCEESLKRTYGTNLERVAHVRQGVYLERCVMIRLKLLKGIMYWYKGDPDTSAFLLEQVEREIRELDVDDEQLSQIAAMGYSVSEARIGLRSARGNLHLAVQHIVDHRQRLEAKEKEEKEEHRKKALGKSLGVSNNGASVRVEVYEQLVSMGFRKSLVTAALREANSDINLALEILRDQVQDEDEDDTQSDEEDMKRMVQENLEEMGFTRDAAEEALRRVGTDLQRAIGLLSSHPNLAAEALQRNEADLAAFRELESEVGNNPFDHLDITFEDEKAVLAEFQRLILAQNSSK